MAHKMVLRAEIPVVHAIVHAIAHAIAYARFFSPCARCLSVASHGKTVGGAIHLPSGNSRTGAESDVEEEKYFR